MNIILIIFLVFIIIFIIYGCTGAFIDKIIEKRKTLIQLEQIKIDALKTKENNLIEKYNKESENIEKLKLILLEKENYYKKCIEDLNNIIEKKCNYYPQLAAIMADLLTLYYEKSSKYLETKKHPAQEEARRIRELRKETIEILKEKKLLQYKIDYIYELFPDIDQIFDNEFEPATTTLQDIEESYDRVRDYLSKEEYNTLSTTQRNQLALDRYINKEKTKWQIGRDYELYVGHIYRQKGYNIEYNGILKKLDDLGRDIIATKNFEVLVIQCKNWSKDKLIHEKHIFQLYGTMVLYKIEHYFTEVKGIFITTTKLSKTAKDIADYLGIIVFEEFKMQEFPRIKCNINRMTGEKIYHLPMDKQYERTVIDFSTGEMFAMTVAEAEAQGFRRAFKHRKS